YPTVSLGTVYKTLDTLEQQGLIHKFRATGESARYDANLEPHHHLVCKVCGRMEDVEGVAAESLQLSKKDYQGFHIEEVRVDFRGICGPCRAKKK
nr:transcriptional repressor [Candidatus Omnitrophota bacterium]